jgi:hypothetical protein
MINVIFLPFLGLVGIKVIPTLEKIKQILVQVSGSFSRPMTLEP